ncbi:MULTISPECIES: HD family hydrolase [unclassified Deinococcus]|uniref:HD domain-containing protein n=1 Tax=unclassified Deinococcus TaxID=2623546 RepID=UPI000CF4C4A4|nr:MULTISPECIES: HD domain-containing protein [unclassified Deinococcus]
MQRLPAQIDFLLACDRLKSVQRTTFLHAGVRAENSAEHSWHLALMALTLGEHAPRGTDLNHVVRLLLIHDLVEIHAGDLPFTATAEQHAAQADAEKSAAARLFGTLPAEQAAEFLALWQEFEACETGEARFARALDALQPMLLTWGDGGLGCAERYPALTAERVLNLKEKYLRDFPTLWAVARELIAQAERTGLIHP